MAFVIKITGGPTLYNATIVDSAVSGMKDVAGMVYPDEHPMFESANTAVYDDAWDAADTPALLPQGYAYACTVPAYKVQEMIEDTNIYQLEPVAPVESQQSETDGPFDEGGAGT